MRKAALLSAVAVSALLIAPAAYADVDVFGLVIKIETLTVTETVNILKTVTIDVDIVAPPDKFAEASAHYNQDNFFNKACENCAEKIDLISGSILGNSGITSVNQSSGNNNNQATLISFAFDVGTVTGSAPPPPPPANGTPGFAHSQVAGSQLIFGNTVSTILVTHRDALIVDSINSNTGITAVNQAAGNINNQANAIAIAFSQATGVALSDAALGQLVVLNNHFESGVFKTASMTGSIQNNTGIVQVNQSAGNLGNQGNAVSLAIVAP